MPDINKTKVLHRRFYFFLFFAISFFSLEYRLKSIGTLLFFVYIVFVFLMKPPAKVTTYLALLSLALIPILEVGAFHYSAGVIGVFSFLLLVMSIIQLFSSFNKRYRNQ